MRSEVSRRRYHIYCSIEDSTSTGATVDGITRKRRVISESLYGVAGDGAVGISHAWFRCQGEDSDSAKRLRVPAPNFLSTNQPVLRFGLVMAHQGPKGVSPMFDAMFVH